MVFIDDLDKDRGTVSAYVECTHCLSQQPVSALFLHLMVPETNMPERCSRLDTLRLKRVNNMAAGRDSDAGVWLHNKLGSTDDLWSGSSICSHMTRERLLSIQECFQHLQPHVKVKLMLSFLHLPKRSVEEVIL